MICYIKYILHTPDNNSEIWEKIAHFALQAFGMENIKHGVAKSCS